MASDQADLLKACRNILPYLKYTISDESPGHHPTMPSAVAAFTEALQAAAAIPPSGEAVAWLNPHNGAIAGQRTRNNTVPLYAAPPAPVAIDEATHRHKKRGTDYVLIGIGKMQADDWYDRDGGWTTTSVDMREVAIYRSADDGSIWVRPREEFEDGRFEYLNPQPNGGA